MGRFSPMSKIGHTGTIIIRTTAPMLGGGVESSHPMRRKQDVPYALPRGGVGVVVGGPLRRGDSAITARRVALARSIHFYRRHRSRRIRPIAHCCRPIGNLPPSQRAGGRAVRCRKRYRRTPRFDSKCDEIAPSHVFRISRFEREL